MRSLPLSAQSVRPAFIRRGNRRPPPATSSHTRIKATRFAACCVFSKCSAFPAQGEELEFPLYDDDYRELHALTGMDALEPGRYVCLHPGARDIAKRWPARHFARIGEALHDIGYRVVLTGSGAERNLTTAIARAMRNPSINCAAPVSVGAIAALLNHARLIVTNDTGVSHIAAALRLPSVVIFSATDPDRWAPLDGTLHRIVRDPGRTDVNGVLRAVQQLLEGTWTPGRDQASVRSALSLSVQRMT